MTDVKQQVREFYDRVGWREIGEGLYQNARYEDLRPVSQEYIHRCHLRVARHLPASGTYLLDAGSGPIQYPEYLEYSRGFRYRVCLDISRQALMEARRRIGDHGLFVVGDVANLPFRPGAFEGVVSLHTIHHLPPEEQAPAFFELLRVLRPGGRAAVVYSWGDHSPLMRLFRRPAAWMRGFLRRYRAWRGRTGGTSLQPEAERLLRTPGTFTYKHDYHWARRALADLPGLDILVWRSVSTAFLRAFVHRRLFGRPLLRLLYWLEERAPRFFGRVGQYPLIVFSKPAAPAREERS